MISSLFVNNISFHAFFYSTFYIKIFGINSNFYIFILNPRLYIIFVYDFRLFKIIKIKKYIYLYK